MILSLSGGWAQKALLAFVVAQGGQETLDTIATFEKVRDDMAVYWSAAERSRGRY